MSDDSSQIASECLCRGAWYDSVHLVIKRPFIHQSVLLFLRGCGAARVVAALSRRLFSGQNESASLFFFLFFLFILTPDKTHRLQGNWSRGSCFVLAVLSGMAINQVIYCVRGDLSLLNSWLVAKKKADATKVLKVCRVHYHLTWKSCSESRGLRNDSSRGRSLRLRQNSYYVNICWSLSIDHDLLQRPLQNKQCQLFDIFQ